MDECFQAWLADWTFKVLPRQGRSHSAGGTAGEVKVNGLVSVGAKPVSD